MYVVISGAPHSRRHHLHQSDEIGCWQRQENGMTTIKATCPGCGEVELTAPDITLAVCPTSPLAYFSFVCPSCAETVRKDADDHIVSLLMSGGVDPIVWDIPAE